MTNSNQSNSKIYFPNLNGLRFIAAFLVIIHHIEQIKSSNNIDSYWQKIPFVEVIGKLGVVLFFVLSGFLITYLLLAEEKVFAKISVRKFYVRRILRIWPLYFLIVVIAFFIVPNFEIFSESGSISILDGENFASKLILFALFFPNLAFAIYGVVPFASHTWSIGTEEQFYILWPIVLKFLKKNRIALMFLIIAIYMFVAFMLSVSITDFIPYKKFIRNFWSMFNIDCMAIGGVFAVMLFEKKYLLKIFMNKYLFYFTILFVLVFMILGVHIPKVHFEFYAVLFGIIILNFAANKNIGLSLENKAFNYLGNISYGLYMYHPIAIVLSIYIAKSINFTSNWLLYPLTLIIVVLLSAISYKYYESIFLKFKTKFTKILSGNNEKM